MKVSVLVLWQLRGTDDARFCRRGERSDWRTVDCGVARAMTSLPKAQSDMPEYAAGDRKLRIEGGGNLLRAAQGGGVRRYLQQSSGLFLKAAVGALADESSPLDLNASPSVAASARTYTELETRLFRCDAIEGVALRYGFFYGPKTWYFPGEAAAHTVMQQQNAVVGRGEGVSSFVHIHDAPIATVALLACATRSVRSGG